MDVLLHKPKLQPDVMALRLALVMDSGHRPPLTKPWPWLSAGHGRTLILLYPGGWIPGDSRLSSGG
jgi:hypothetical protein